ncbi:hypothetical protein MASR1M107_13820 [Ignavibacteriales bacterium]|mgnify:FL=1
MKNILVTLEVDKSNLDYTTRLVNDFAQNIKELHPGLNFFKAMTSAAKPANFYIFLSFDTDKDYDDYKMHERTKKFTVRLHAMSKGLPVFTELNEVNLSSEG